MPSRANETFLEGAGEKGGCRCIQKEMRAQACMWTPIRAQFMPQYVFSPREDFITFRVCEIVAPKYQVMTSVHKYVRTSTCCMKVSVYMCFCAFALRKSRSQGKRRQIFCNGMLWATYMYVSLQLTGGEQWQWDVQIKVMGKQYGGEGNR
jgi:hypothetical protein